MTEDIQPKIARREPSVVMKLERLGSLHQCRLSFMRQLTRRMAAENWQFSTPVFQIDDQGVGHAVYCAKGPHRTYSLVAFAHDLPADQRSDRVIAEAWDATFTLFDGVPSKNDIERLSKNVPLQEAGRVSGTELSLSRANRSVRLWEHVVESLANGSQPDSGQIDNVGYLMRTTAVYGSGKFGACDREQISEREELHAPFQVEMLSVYLTRTFVRDLVEHMACKRGGANAVRLEPAISRRLGIGNSTGLGMAPFVINHPVLFNNWLQAREDAIARIRSIPQASEAEVALFSNILQSCQSMVDSWRSEHPLQISKIENLKADLEKLLSFALTDSFANLEYPWNRLVEWSGEGLSVEGQELVLSLILEPYGDLIDELTKLMAEPSGARHAIDGSMTIGNLKALIKKCFGWAVDVDWNARENCARAWYVSAEKLEPRLGERFEEDIEAYEQPLAPARDGVLCLKALDDWVDEKPVAEFLLTHSEFRHTVRRAQISAKAPFSEICDNTISDTMLPIDMLRAKLSFFGATHFDPRSDRWVRICMYSGAPYPEELSQQNADYWVYSAVAQ